MVWGTTEAATGEQSAQEESWDEQKQGRKQTQNIGCFEGNVRGTCHIQRGYQKLLVF